MKRITALIIITFVAAGVVASLLTAPLSAQIVPTNEWVNFYGTNSLLDGTLLPPGSVVRAYDPDDVLCGIFTTINAGHYGVLAVYRDDPLSPADEGAEPGDTIHFTINGWPAAPMGPDSPVWTSNGDLLLVELSADSSSPAQDVYLPLILRQFPMPTPTPTATWTPTATRTPTPTSTPGGVGSVYGHVFNDLNSNSRWDVDEPTLSGATLTLDGIYTYLTSGDGYYYFGGLTPGRHTLVETNPAGYPVSTTPDRIEFDIPTMGAMVQYNFGDRAGVAPTPTPTPPVSCPDPFTVDDLDPGFALYGTSSYWHGVNMGYAGHLWWTFSNHYTMDNWARWHPTMPATMRYRVDVYIPAGYSSHTPTSQARYMVYHRDGVTPVVVDQSAHPDQWVTLGEFCFTAGTGGRVELTDATGEAAGERVIAFDAVRWTCVGPCGPIVGTPTLTPTATPTPTSLPPHCYEGLANTSFEEDRAWEMRGAKPGRYTWTTAHSGARSGLMGFVPPEDDFEAHGSIYQAINIPADASSATLRFWYKPFAEAPHTGEPDAYDWTGFEPGKEVHVDEMNLPAIVDNKLNWAYNDWQFTLIRYGRDGNEWDPVLRTNSNAGVWREMAYDLTPWRGQTIWVHFEVRNDGDGYRSWMYVDDVSVTICR